MYSTLFRNLLRLVEVARSLVDFSGIKNAHGTKSWQQYQHIDAALDTLALLLHHYLDEE